MQISKTERSLFVYLCMMCAFIFRVFFSRSARPYDARIPQYNPVFSRPVLFCGTLAPHSSGARLCVLFINFSLYLFYHKRSKRQCWRSSAQKTLFFRQRKICIWAWLLSVGVFSGFSSFNRKMMLNNVDIGK